MSRGAGTLRLGRFYQINYPRVKLAKLEWARELIEVAGDHHGLVIEGLRGGYNR